MNDKPKYACPKCGAIEFITTLNSWDRFRASADKLYWQSTDTGNEKFELYCDKCGEHAPEHFLSALA